MSETPLYET